METKNKRLLALATTAYFNDRGCHLRIEKVMTEFMKESSVELIAYNQGRNRKGLKIFRIIKAFSNEYDYIGFDFRKIVLDFLIFSRAYGLIEDNNYDATLCFTYEAGFIGLLLRLFTGREYILDYQGSMYGELVRQHRVFRIFPLNIFIIYIEKMVEHYASLIVYNTKSAFNSSKKKNKILIDDHYMPELSKPHIIKTFREGNEKIIVWMGIMTNVQGYDIMFDVAERILEKRKNVKFIVIGYPVKKEFTERFKKYSERFIFTGRVQIEYIPSILSEADICISTKRESTEGSSKLYFYRKYGQNIIALRNRTAEEILDESEIADNQDELEKKILKIVDTK